MTEIAQVVHDAREHGMSYGEYVAAYGPTIAKPAMKRVFVHRNIKRKIDVPPVQCKYCGLLIEHPKSRQREYCCYQCRYRAYRKRKSAHPDGNPE